MSALPSHLPPESIGVAVVADALPALISYLDRDQRYQFVNQRYEAWFGLNREDVLGKSMREVLGEVAAERIQPFIERVLRGEEVQFEREMPYERAGVRWIDARYVPDRDANGQVRGFFALIVDITERKHVEAALAQAARQKEALYQLSERKQHARTLAEICDAALEAIEGALQCQRASILLFDETGLMQFVAWRGLSDAYRAAVAGHSPWAADAVDPKAIEIADLAASDVEPGLRQTILAEGIRALAFIPLISGGRLIGKFMAYFDEPHTLSEDEIELATTIARQLAFAIGRIRADEALRASEQRLRQIIDALPAAIYTTDADGRVTHFNPAAVEFTGRTPELGADWCVSWKLFYPDGSPMPFAECPMATALQENRIVRGAEAIAERPDGSRRWFTPFPTPLRDDNGRLVGGVNMLVDITERKRTEEALREADRRKDEFLAMLAHELRNPLAPITNAVHLLRSAHTGDPVQQQAHGIIARQAARLTRLVDDLLEISRITTGRIQLHTELIALGGVIERAVESARSLIEQHGHALEVSVATEPIWLHADAARIEQVLVNLLNNAAKYTDRGGRIQVIAHTEGADAIVRVIDSGIGIEPELLPHIFDLFTQAERSLDRSQGGLGIGLSLVQRLVAMHGGSVHARSVVGRGSEFIVHLPTVHGDTRTPPIQDAPVSSKRARPLRVLVVDDNVDAAQSLALLLEASGHHVRVAHHGAEAFDAVREHSPHAIFLDIGLPGLDGYEIARRLRRDGSTALLIAVTGYGQAADRERSGAAGYDHHLVKPADFGKIEEILLSVARDS